MSRRRRVPRGVRPARPSNDRVDVKVDASWHVRPISGSASVKDYRCPGCSQLIRPATPHLVVWPVEKALLSESAIDERRHWHQTCWVKRH